MGWKRCECSRKEWPVYGDIDAGMVFGYKFPIGPLVLSDMIGLNVRLAFANHLHGELGERFKPLEIRIDHVSVGRLGRKVGQRFFEW